MSTRHAVASLVSAFILYTITVTSAQNYIGAGQDAGVTVTASSHYADSSLWIDTAWARHTLDGQGMYAAHYDAGRFLTQAAIGYEARHLDSVVKLGYEGWIDAQYALPPTYIYPELLQVEALIKDSLAAAGTDSATLADRQPRWPEFNYAWWQVNMTNEDLLRHKVASALSEILVISRLSDLSEYGDGMADYYDVLLEHAFGNYRNLLYDVSLHPCMGFYLTHLNNPKTDTAQDIRPDENYAREIMQLFTIGLYELNIDGSRKVVQGQEVPTYGQDDIREMAKVFTGFGIGDVRPNMYYTEPEFGLSIFWADVTVPMRMWDDDDPTTMYEDEDQHEDGDKYILRDTVHADTSGLHEVNQALDILFHHENVGPFLAHLMIQRLVKSNPSPGYITRVAQAFNDNGSGVRGDMKALIKAILLDPEARDCPDPSDPSQNKLREPLHRQVHFLRSIDKTSPYGLYWNVNYSFFNATRQDIMASPSVFNFYLPTDAPNGPISDQDLVAPEFKLHNSRSSVGYMNYIYGATGDNSDLMGNWTGFDFGEVRWDHPALYPLSRDPEYYINYLDLRFTHGSISDEYRNYIRAGLNMFDPYRPWHHAERYRTRLGMYYTLVSPYFSVVK